MDMDFKCTICSWRILFADHHSLIMNLHYIPPCGQKEAQMLIITTNNVQQKALVFPLLYLEYYLFESEREAKTKTFSTCQKKF